MGRSAELRHEIGMITEAVEAGAQKYLPSGLHVRIRVLEIHAKDAIQAHLIVLSPKIDHQLTVAETIPRIKLMSGNDRETLEKLAEGLCGRALKMIADAVGTTIECRQEDGDGFTGTAVLRPDGWYRIQGRPAGTIEHREWTDSGPTYMRRMKEQMDAEAVRLAQQEVAAVMREVDELTAIENIPGWGAF